ncbi:MAG: SAM-dependent methyltransferase [Candidatus Micrarchaeia archaeon]
MEEEFAALADPRFYIQALKELKSLFPNAEFKRVAQDSSTSVIFASCKNCRGEFDFGTPLSYVYEIFPVFTFIKDIDAEYFVVAENVFNMILGLSSEKKSFRIEVKKVDYKSEEHAKDLEVKIGREIESLGLVADLKNPALQINIVLTSRGAIIGLQSLAKRSGLDAFRYFNKSNPVHINRSEFKLIEAVEHFGISIKEGARCIDVGSAPGGWTHFLLSNGAKVLAIDSAFMSYDLMPKQSRILVVLNDYSKNAALQEKAKARKIEAKSMKEFEELAAKSDIFENYDLVHLVFNMSNALPPAFELLGRFSMLAIDINKEPDEAAAVVALLGRFLAPGSAIIITIKMPEPKPEHYIEKARSLLSKFSSEIKFAKLRHNRQELTAFAIFKAPSDRPLP